MRVSWLFPKEYPKNVIYIFGIFAKQHKIDYDGIYITRLITALAIAPGNRRVAYATAEDNRIYVWDWVTAETVITLPGHSASVASLQFHPTDAELLVTTQNEVIVWKVGQSSQRTVLEQTGHTQSIARYLPNSPYIITADDTGQLCLWAGSTEGYILHAPIPAHSQGISALTVSRDGKHVVSAGRDGSVMLWRVETQLTPSLQ